MNKKKDNPDHFEILRKLQKNPKSTQRELASSLGFSLGKLNYCLKALQDKGFVKIKNFNKNKFYTPKDIANILGLDVSLGAAYALVIHFTQLTTTLVMGILIAPKAMKDLRIKNVILKKI